jgi:hypothetical protein
MYAVENKDPLESITLSLDADNKEKFVTLSNYEFSHGLGTLRASDADFV